MPPEQDFQPFATQAGANVVSQAIYNASPYLGSGFQSGIAPSAAFNKVWRQSSIIAAVIAKTISDVLGVNVIDDGTTATIEANFIQLIRAGGLYVIDSGSTNTIVVTLAPAPVSLASMLGIPLFVKVKATNSGATTINLNNFGGIAVTTNALASLSSSAITANGIITLVYDGTVFQKVSP
jgi:hypothetical protein